MDTARERAAGDPWRESLERSLARRQRSTRPPAAPDRMWRDRAVAALALMPRLGPRGVAGLALAAAIVASSLASGGPQATPTAARAAATTRITAGSPRASAPIAPSRTAGCPLAASTTGYVNPVAGATLKRERIDQGVDYAGSGTLVALGAGRVTYVATNNSGWPGTFIEYQLLGGADAGCYVYYAEGVTPVDGLTVGQTVAAGQPIATIIPNWPTGIEVGWGSGRGTKAYAKVAGQWSTTDDEDNIATAAGKNFSALIAALGGPPGKVEG